VCHCKQQKVREEQSMHREGGGKHAHAQRRRRRKACTSYRGAKHAQRRRRRRRIYSYSMIL